MEGQAAVDGEGPHKLLRETCVILPHPFLGHLRLIDQERPVGDVQGGEAQSLVHGHVGAGESADALPVADSPTESLAQDNAGVLHRVVAVHLQVALGLQLQAEPGVEGQGVEHVVKKADAGGHLHLSPVQAEVHADVGLLGLAFNDIGPDGSVPCLVNLGLHQNSSLDGASSKRTRMAFAWAVSRSASARAMIWSFTGASCSFS